MVRELAPLVGSLRCDSHERLHGVFISDETSSNQPDAENIAFYNFGSAPFTGANSVLAFERSYAEAPRPPRPLAAPARYYHVWSVVPENAPFEHWIEDDVVASWKAVPFDLMGISVSPLGERCAPRAGDGRLRAWDVGPLWHRRHAGCASRKGAVHREGGKGSSRWPTRRPPACRPSRAGRRHAAPWATLGTPDQRVDAAQPRLRGRAATAPSTRTVQQERSRPV